MKKMFCVIAWISGVIGIVLMLVGGIRFFTENPFLGIKNWDNAFYPAYNFLLLSLLMVVASRQECKK